MNEEKLLEIMNELNFTAVQSALAVLNEIAAKCNNFDEFKICLDATVNNLREKK